jgi:hypothetical protein
VPPSWPRAKTSTAPLTLRPATGALVTTPPIETHAAYDGLFE